MKKFVRVIIFLIPVLLWGSSLWDGEPIGSSASDTSQLNRYYVPILLEDDLLNFTPRDDRNGWAIRGGNACAGCPSYFWKILRTRNTYKAEDGNSYYYYYLYFYSNSFYEDGSRASTYLSDVKIIVGEKEIFEIPYILISKKGITMGAWVRSKNPFEVLDFSSTNIKVY